jgi:hydrogenase maturation protein HypF
MPGAEKAAREPWRMALSYLYQSFGGKLPDFPGADQLYGNGADLLVPLLREKINSPVTTSAGRLFDAVAAVLGINHYATYEGEAAILLEAASRRGGQSYRPYPFEIQDADFYHIDYSGTIRQIVNELCGGVSIPEIAGRFHDTVVSAIVALCCKIKAQTGINRVALSGGVFQNVRMIESTCRQLGATGFEVYYHRLVPPNDGGISLGQSVIASQY